jgi:hypothetical protein
MKELLHEGLIIHTRMFYVLQQGRRVYSEDLETKAVGDDPDTWFEFEAYMFPPLLLLPTTWQRYGYTSEDVHLTYEKMDASYVWQVALLLMCGTYEPEAAAAGVRPTFQSPFAFNFISRKTVFDVFFAEQQNYISQKSAPVLCLERPDHRPPLPKVWVTADVFERALRLVPERHPSFCWSPRYPQLFPYKDITLVPVEFDELHHLVYMVRVVKKSVYEALPVKPKLCVVTLPVWVYVGADTSGNNGTNGTRHEVLQKIETYVMTEEACFFAVGPRTEEPHALPKAISRKRKLGTAAAEAAALTQLPPPPPLPSLPSLKNATVVKNDKLTRKKRKV